MKKYLDITVWRNDGSHFNNPLKLSEVHLVNKLAKENQRLTVFLTEVSKETYKFIFG